MVFYQELLLSVAEQMLWCEFPRQLTRETSPFALVPTPLSAMQHWYLTGSLMLFWELLQNMRGCKMLGRNQECFYVTSHPSIKPPPFSLHCEGKSACPYHMEHPANLGWWEAQFPEQGDAFAIYFLKQKTFLI